MVVVERENSTHLSSTISSLSRRRRYALFEGVSLEDRSVYHQLSQRPLTPQVENDMELLSDIVTWGELYLHHWHQGIYNCSRCGNLLYRSQDKWKGPCVWPSFRKPADDLSISTTEVKSYNGYSCTVKEVYCRRCDLFIGHQFRDGKDKGDNHPEAEWRH